MNFRQHFEAWHKAKYGYIGKYTGTAMHITYQTTACQQRWEAWQACADWHTAQELEDTSCPTCGEDGGTSCGIPNCGLLQGDKT